MESAILLKRITILPMTRAEDLLEGDLLIRRGRIAYLGPSRDWVDEDGLEVYQGKNKVAIPGFVNAHTHLGMTFLRGFADDMDLHTWLVDKIWPMETKLRPGDVYCFSLLGALELIAAGVTTFADMYWSMEEVARVVTECGLRACLSQALIVAGKDHPERELEGGLRFALENRGAAEGRITTMLAPHAVYTCPPDFLKLVREAAIRERLGLHIHLSETRKEVEDCRIAYGATPPRLLRNLGLFELPILAIHCIWPEEGDFSILAKAKGVVHCPTSNLKIAAGIAPVTKLLSSGSNVALGTDGACSNNRLEMLQEIKTAALLAKTRTRDPKALPAFRALQMATLGGARALGLEEQIGTLEAWKQADITIFDFDAPHLTPCFDHYSHLAYAALPSDVTAVMVQGRWLYKNRRHLTLDRPSVQQEAVERVQKLMSR
ncbi:MAG: amidohydrolase [Coprothermobacterota bacterium]|nr:amidohydrolase [Coprothermobacterota bacterium]